MIADKVGNTVLQCAINCYNDASDRQINSAEIDHSLTLKVADELVRIEMNLSRMDTSVRGYKQLSKAV